PLPVEGVQSLGQGLARFRLGEIAAEIGEALCERLPLLGVHRATPGELADSLTQMFAKLLVAERLAIDPENRQLFGKMTVEIEVMQGRDQFTPGQIAAGTENNKDRRQLVIVPFH